MNKKQHYPLGYTEREAQRLMTQATRVEELTEDVFRRAGISAGMQVLDIGCGAGDVSLLAAKMVGDDGAVLGVDRASSSVELAMSRAAESGAHNIAFEASDLANFETDRKFDVLLGRFVLAYIPDRVEVLRRLAKFLKPDATVVFLELDMTEIAQLPPSALFTEVRQWGLEAFSAGGAELQMGAKLYATFKAAGIPEPDMIAVQPAVGGPNSFAYEELVQALSSLQPVIEQNGIASSGQMELDTLADRLREDAESNDCVIYLSRVVGAWAHFTS